MRKRGCVLLFPFNWSSNKIPMKHLPIDTDKESSLEDRWFSDWEAETDDYRNNSSTVSDIEDTYWRRRWMQT